MFLNPSQYAGHRFFEESLATSSLISGPRREKKKDCWPAGGAFRRVATLLSSTIFVAMNTCCFNRKWIVFSNVLLVCTLATVVRAAEPTAFELIKEANRYVGEQSKDKLVQLRSEKSVGKLEPTIWYVVLYDSTATLKAVEVKFGAGKMLSVKRPFRLLEPVTGGDVPLDRSKLSIDSDKAISIATAEPLLKDLKISATQLKLERVGEGVLGQGGVAEAVWKVKLWAVKLRQPNKDADIGEVWVSASDGKVVKDDLHINRVD